MISILLFIFSSLFFFSPPSAGAQALCNVPIDYCTPDPECDPDYTYSPSVGGCDPFEVCCVRNVAAPTPVPLPTCDPSFLPSYGTSGPGCAIGSQFPGCWPTNGRVINQPPCPPADPEYCTQGASRSHCGRCPGCTSCNQFLWNSLDIDASIGTPVYATHNGTVGVASDPGWGGNVVIIGNGVSSIYAHLSWIFVRVGEVVTQGRPIGLTGNTGNSTGPHLHYGISYSQIITNTLGNCTADACIVP